MTKLELIALAERCEKVEGPCMALDYEIHCRNGLWGVGMYGDHPRYTASLDAAMTLVPENAGPLEIVIAGSGQAFIHSNDPCGGYLGSCQYAATPALALTAVSLRAHGEMCDGIA